LSLALTLPVQAAPQWCTGTMSNLWVASDGQVYVNVSWRGDYVTLCNLNQAWNSISPTTCAAWFAAARSAVQRNAATTIQYADAPACSAMPVYGAAPPPYYVMLNN
jgi:hypothetical protein